MDGLEALGAFASKGAPRSLAVKTQDNLDKGDGTDGLYWGMSFGFDLVISEDGGNFLQGGPHFSGYVMTGFQVTSNIRWPDTARAAGT